MVLAIGARATTHIPSMKHLETKMKIPITKIKITFKQINIIVAKYVHSIHEQRLENQQPITYLHNSP
jgi:hypothetical protein